MVKHEARKKKVHYIILVHNTSYSLHSTSKQRKFSQNESFVQTPTIMYTIFFNLQTFISFFYFHVLKMLISIEFPVSIILLHDEEKKNGYFFVSMKFTSTKFNLILSPPFFWRGRSYFFVEEIVGVFESPPRAEE